MAAKHAHVEVLKILLEAQANTNLKNKVCMLTCYYTHLYLFSNRKEIHLFT